MTTFQGAGARIWPTRKTCISYQVIFEELSRLLCTPDARVYLFFVGTSRGMCGERGPRRPRRRALRAAPRRPARGPRVVSK